MAVTIGSSAYTARENWQALLDFSGDANNTHGELEGIWAGGDIDFSAENIEPFERTIYIRGKIDFNGATFKNMTWYSGGSYCLRFVIGDSGVIKNLKIENMTIYNASVNTLLSHSDASSETGTFFNCQFNINWFSMDTSNEFRFLDLTKPRSCSFTLKGNIASGLLVIANGTDYRDCLFDLDINYNKSATTNLIPATLINCLIRGKVINHNTTEGKEPRFTNTRSEFNSYILKGADDSTSGSYYIQTGGKSIYDPTHMTLTSADTNMLPYNPSNPDMGALQLAGFPCYAGE